MEKPDAILALIADLYSQIVVLQQEVVHLRNELETKAKVKP